MTSKLEGKNLLSYFSPRALTKGLTEEERAEVRKKQNVDSHRKLCIAAVVFIFIQLFFIISDLSTGFYSEQKYSFLNMTAEGVILLSSVLTLALLLLMRDREADTVGRLQLFYYLALETGVLLFFAGDVLRDISNITNAFYNMVILAIFAVYAVEHLVLLTSYISVGTLVVMLSLSEELVWANLQLMILFLVLLFACANYFRAANTRFFCYEIKLQHTTDRLKDLSNRDFLTKVANRTALGHHIRHRVAEAVEKGIPVGILMLDIDDFKAFNDYHSHMDGDLCLHELGAVLLKLENDRFRVFRYGGEEFLAVAIGVHEEELRAFAGSLLTSVHEMAFQREDGVNESGCITVSIGCAMAKLRSTDDFADLLRMADKELYNAKRAGKDCYLYRGVKYTV